MLEQINLAQCNRHIIKSVSRIFGCIASKFNKSPYEMVCTIPKF